MSRGYRGWKYERPTDMPLTLVAATEPRGPGAHVLLMDEGGNKFDCQLASKRGPKWSSGSSSSCAGDCEADEPGPKRQRSRAPNEPGIGMYGHIGDTETKYVDNRTQAEEPLDSAPVSQVFNAIKTGDQFYEKIGNRITMMDLEFFYRIQSSGAGQDRGDVIRILIVYDRQPTNQAGKGHLPDKDVLIKSYLPDGSTSSTSEDNINPTQIKRFLILLDYKIYMSNDASAASIDTVPTKATNTNIDRNAKVSNRILIPLNGLMTHYRPHEVLDPVEPNPSIRQITMGSLFMYAFGLHEDDSGWNFHYTARLRYKDA